MDSTISIIIDIFSGILLNIFCMYFCYNLLGKKLVLNEKKNIIILVVMTLSAIALNYFFPKTVKFVLSFIVLMLIVYFITDRKIYKALIIFILLEISMSICEMIYSFIINFIIKDDSILLVEVFSHIFLIGLGMILVKSKIPKKIYEMIINSTESIKKNEFIVYSLMIIFIIIFSTIESYINLPISIVILTNTIIAMVFIFLIGKLINTKNRYYKINNKYQTSISSLKEYEEMIDKYKVNNHENKNELMTIRSMIKSKDKNTIEYIDKLVDNKVKDNEKIMYKTSKIPEGGLRATIYSKLTLMDKYKIKYTLDIASDVRTVDLINLGDELVLNVCKILGVFLDNSIDAVRKLKKKNIIIEFYFMDGYLNIDITNNFKGDLDLNKLGTIRYTTKGEGHGYGLSLVNRIIAENSKVLTNEKSISGDLFTQRLKIKM